MKVHNKTNAPTFVSLDTPDSKDCGKIDPGGSKDFPFLNDKPAVMVTFGFPDDNPSIELPGNRQVTIEVKQGD